MKRLCVKSKVLYVDSSFENSFEDIGLFFYFFEHKMFVVSFGDDEIFFVKRFEILEYLSPLCLDRVTSVFGIDQFAIFKIQ